MEAVLEGGLLKIRHRHGETLEDMVQKDAQMGSVLVAGKLSMGYTCSLSLLALVLLCFFIFIIITILMFEEKHDSSIYLGT